MCAHLPACRYKKPLPAQYASAEKALKADQAKVEQYISSRSISVVRCLSKHSVCSNRAYGRFAESDASRPPCHHQHVSADCVAERAPLSCACRQPSRQGTSSYPTSWSRPASGHRCAQDLRLECVITTDCTAWLPVPSTRNGSKTNSGSKSHQHRSSANCCCSCSLPL